MGYLACLSSEHESINCLKYLLKKINKDILIKGKVLHRAVVKGKISVL